MEVARCGHQGDGRAEASGGRPAGAVLSPDPTCGWGLGLSTLGGRARPCGDPRIAAAAQFTICLSTRAVWQPSVRRRCLCLQQVPAVGGVMIYYLEACQDVTLSLCPGVLPPLILGLVEAGKWQSHKDGQLHASRFCASAAFPGPRLLPRESQGPLRCREDASGSQWPRTGPEDRTGAQRGWTGRGAQAFSLFQGRSGVFPMVVGSCDSHP